MPINTDIRQAVILALESQGADALTTLAAQLKNLEDLQGAINQQYADGSITANQYVSATNGVQAAVVKNAKATKEAIEMGSEWLALQEKLGQMEKANADAAVAGQQATANARQEGINAIKGYVSAAEQAKQAEGDAMRARIDAYARAERAAEQEAAKQKQLAGDVLRAKVDALAREERAQEAVRDQLQKNRDAYDKEAAAEAWVTKQTIDLTHALEGLAEAERTASTYSFFADAGRNAAGKTTQEMQGLWQEIQKVGQTSQVAQGGISGLMSKLNPFGDQTVKAAVATKRLNEQIDDTNRASKQSGYGMLSFAHAMQDAQYGTAAVLNNIPLMVQALGGTAGLAGTVMIAGVAFELLKPHLETVGRRLNLLRDPLRDATSGLAGLTEQVEALESKPFKVGTDYTALRELREEIKKTTQAIADWESLKSARNESQTSSKSIIEEGIREGGGAKNVENAILAVKKRQGTLYAGSTQVGDLAVAQQRMANARRLAVSARKTIGSTAGDAADLVTEYYRSEVARIQFDMDKEAREKIATTVDNASRHEGARKELEDYYLNNKDIFKANGVTNRFGVGIVAGSSENVAAQKENAKAAKEQADAIKDAKKKQDEKDRKDAEVNATVQEMADDASRENKQQDRQDKVEGKAFSTAAAKKAADAQREAHRQGGLAAPGLIPQIQATLAETVDQGGSVEVALAQMVQALKANGMQAGVASDVVGRGFAEFQQVLMQNMATFNDQTMAVAATLQDAILDQRRIAERGFQNNVKINGLGRAQARGRAQQPTLSPTFQ